jgi:integrase
VDPEAVEKLIRELVDDWFERMVAEDRRERRQQQDFSEMGKHFNLIAQDEAEALDEGRLLPHIKREASEVIERAGVELDDDQRRALAWELSRANIRLLREMAEERQADLLGKPRASERRHVQPEPPKGPRKAGVTVEQAIEEYIRIHDGRPWGKEYVVEVSHYLEKLVEHLGAPSPDIAEVTKQHLVDFREALRSRVGEVTVGKYMNCTARFLRYCVEWNWIEQSPADNLPGGLAQKDTRPQEELREAVSDDDLEKILGCEAFRDLRDGGDLARERYWALLMLAYTGARRNEIAQAWAEDVLEVDGVWSLQIKPGSDPEAPKRVKTPASTRVVPLHSDLLDLGLLKFAEAATTKRLFPRAWQRNGDLLTKWWNRQRKRAGASPGTQVHGLRHRVTTQLKNAGVHEARISTILGHSQQSLAMGRYGKSYDMPRLVEAVEMIDNRGPLGCLFDR